jgi:hypothetical protein
MFIEPYEQGVTMPKNLIQSLVSSDQPHLYLLNVGLTQENYKLISNPSLDEKEKLAKKIMDNCSHEQILKIIRRLSELEFEADADNPIRAGKPLIAVLIRLYISKLEQENFRSFYDKKKKPDEQNWSKCPISNQAKQIWSVVAEAAKKILDSTHYDQFMEKGFRILPTFYYEQILQEEITQEQFDQGVRPVILSRENSVATQLNELILTDVPPLPNLNQSFDLDQKLTDIKKHIESTEWKVGNYILFQGGVMHGTQRVPHRINDILNLLEKAASAELTAQEAYDQIVDKAKEALDFPRRGRVSSTTEFYEKIFSHNILDESYQLTHADSFHIERTPLLTAVN